MLTSHARRQDLIADSILGLGGEPPTNSGVWGVYAKVFQAGADLLGDRPAIAALEAGEDRCPKLYIEGPGGCDGETRQLIDEHLLPAHRRTNDLCKTLRDYVTAPS